MAHIVLAWNAVPGASSYTVYRDGTKVQDGLAAPGWTDMNVVSGQTYTYTVTATGPGGEGARIRAGFRHRPEAARRSGDADRADQPERPGLWQGAPTDVLAWSPVPGAVSYNVYQYDVPIATGLTATSYHRAAGVFCGGMTYTVTAVDAMGMESLPSAIATAQGAVRPGAAAAAGRRTRPSRPDALVADARMERRRSAHPSVLARRRHRLHLQRLPGRPARSRRPVGAELLTTRPCARARRIPTPSPASTCPGRPPWKAPRASPSRRGTASAAAPAAARRPVQITDVQPNDDSVVVSFAAVPGAADYRVYDAANPEHGQIQRRRPEH